MNIRQSIRESLKTLLTGLTTTGSSIYASRVRPLSSPKLPCLLIYTDAERTSYVTMGLPRTQERTLNVKVEAYVKANTGYDNKLDDISAEIEAAVYSDVTLGGLVKDVKVTGFDAQFSGDGDQPVAVGQFTVEVIYHTKEGSPTV